MPPFENPPTKWKRATIITIAVLMSVVIVTICLSVSIIHESLVVRRAAQVAVGVSDRNKLPQPTPSTTLPPLPSANIGDHQFNKFAADLVVRLELGELEPPQCLMTTSELSSKFGKNNAWVLEGDGQLWIVFRGTATKDEWEQDFEINQAPLLARLLSKHARKIAYPAMAVAPQTRLDHDAGSDMMAHSGFLKIYNDVADSIHQAIEQSSAPNVCIVGHSLGGALAQITALDVCATHPEKVVNATVFGCPRVGNPSFSKQLTSSPNMTLSVFTNTCDIVPNLPLAVQPTLKAPDTPIKYTHPIPTQSYTFTDNQGSWVDNHAMQTYMNYIIGDT